MLGSLPVYLVMLTVSAGIMFAGVSVAFSRDGSLVAGLALMFLAAGLWRFAQRARAEYTYGKGIDKLASWAQGLGPDSQKGRRR